MLFRSEQHDDLLAMLMLARDRKTGDAMDERLLLDEVMTLVVAGHETTASALSWLWYSLSQHPHVEQRLHAELDCLDAPPADLESLAALPYTRQVIEETLRLYPPGWLLTRQSIDADEIAGCEVAPDTDIFICPYIVHRHPAFWADPERFDPERFSAEASATRSRYTYLPFALGPRACIGEHFAMAEMLIHVAMLARHIRLRYLPTAPVELQCRINLR